MLAEVDRRGELLEAARRHHLVRPVAPDAADAWRQEWAAILARAYMAPPQPVTPPAAAPVPVLKLAKLRVQKPSALRVNLRRLPRKILKPGAWLEIPLGSQTLVGQVLGLILPGQSLRLVVGEHRMHLLERGTTETPHRPLTRVALLIPAALRSRPLIKILYLGAVVRRAKRLPEPPADLPFRMPAPLPPGAFVCWGWHSRFGHSAYLGRVVAYVPAGVSIQALGFGVRSSVQDVSRQDRYLVRCDGETHLVAPVAYVCEGGYLHNLAEPGA